MVDTSSTSPTRNVQLVSLCTPSRKIVTSMLMMSPSRSWRLSGMPWQMTSLTDVHTDLGEAAIVQRAGIAVVAEAIHSVADSGNQLLLLLGGSGRGAQATPEHPFGYGRERYFYAFVVSIVLFSVGGLFALYEGVAQDHAPARARDAAVGDRRAGRRDRPGGRSRLRTAIGESSTTLKGTRSWSASSATRSRPSCPSCCSRTRRADRPGVRAVRGRDVSRHRRRRSGTPSARGDRRAAGRHRGRSSASR